MEQEQCGVTQCGWIVDIGDVRYKKANRKRQKVQLPDDVFFVIVKSHHVCHGKTIAHRSLPNPPMKFSHAFSVRNKFCRHIFNIKIWYSYVVEQDDHECQGRSRRA